MINDVYKTLAAPSEGIFKDRGSRFIALAFPVNTEEEIKSILTKLRKHYHDATHHCYAYRLGAEQNIFRVNDNGEPSGSAGKPIFGQILSKNLTNILIVVIRYYGGVKLGVGGLINAYRTASSNVINNGQIIEKTVDVFFEFRFDYLSMNKVMKIIKDENIKQHNQRFDLDCSITLSIRKKEAERVMDSFKKIEKLEIKILN